MTEKKIYSVSVHYDAVKTVDVCATNVDDAYKQAIDECKNAPDEEFKKEYSDAYVEKILNIGENNLKLNQSPEVLEAELIGKEGIKLSKEETPIAFTEKVHELLLEGNCSTIKEAEEEVSQMEITLEIYYHKHYGLFAVETEAVESGNIYSPYSGEKYEPINNNN